MSFQFDEVWYTDHCAQKCECEEDDGEGHIECDDDECDGDDICYMDGEGEYTCKSTGKQVLQRLGKVLTAPTSWVQIAGSTHTDLIYAFLVLFLVSVSAVWINVNLCIQHICVHFGSWIDISFREDIMADSCRVSTHTCTICS